MVGSQSEAVQEVIVTCFETICMGLEVIVTCWCPKLVVQVHYGLVSVRSNQNHVSMTGVLRFRKNNSGGHTD